jgi:hypothetical protein
MRAKVRRLPAAEAAGGLSSDEARTDLSGGTMPEDDDGSGLGEVGGDEGAMLAASLAERRREEVVVVASAAMGDGLAVAGGAGSVWARSLLCICFTQTWHGWFTYIINDNDNNNVL